MQGWRRMEKREREEKNERERKDKEAQGGYKANVGVGGWGCVEKREKVKKNERKDIEAQREKEKERGGERR